MKEQTMSGSNVAVLDFGSSKLTVLVGEKGFGSSFRLKAKGSSDYAGFMDGEFLDANGLKNSIFAAIDQAEKMLKKKIKTIYVGVPAEFCYNQCVALDLFFTSKTKLKKWHTNRLFSMHKDKEFSTTHTIIDRTALYYKLDDGTKVLNPVGKLSNDLHALVSYVFADNRFVKTVEQALGEIGLHNYEFISSSLAESIYLLDEQTRTDGVVLIDCGYITTGIAHCLGDGVLDLKSFSLGGGHITSDISELLKIPFESAEELKRKMVVSLDAKPQDYYEAMVNGKPTKFSAKTVNDIALARVDMILEAILKSFADFSHLMNGETKVFLTGGGLAYTKGMRDYISNYFKREVTIIAPSPLQFNKPDLSSEISLLQVAIWEENS